MRSWDVDVNADGRIGGALVMGGMLMIPGYQLYCIVLYCIVL